MKNFKFPIFLLLVLVGFALISIPTKATTNNSIEYNVTSIKALDKDGNEIENGSGYFTFTDHVKGPTNESSKILLGYYPYVFYVPLTATDNSIDSSVGYQIDVDDLPVEFYKRDSTTKELIIDPTDFGTIFVINGYWATSSYTIIKDLNGDILENNIIGYLSSINSISEEECYYIFKVLYKNQLAIEPYDVLLSSKVLTDDIINTFNTKKMIGIKDNRWIIVDKYEFVEKVDLINGALTRKDGTSIKPINMNALKDCYFYANFNIPIDNIYYFKIKMSYTVDRFWLFPDKGYYIFSLKSNESNVISSIQSLENKLYVNPYAEKGLFIVEDNNYIWRLNLSADVNWLRDGNLPNLDTNWDKEGQLLELSYSYLGITYHFSGSDEFIIDNVPEREKTLWEQVVDFINDLWGKINIYVLIAGVLIGSFYLIKFIKKIKSNKKNKNDKYKRKK